MDRIHKVASIAGYRVLIPYEHAPGFLRNLPDHLVISVISLDQIVNRHVWHVVKAGKRSPGLLLRGLVISELSRKCDQYHEACHALAGLHEMFQIVMEEIGRAHV